MKAPPWLIDSPGGGKLRAVLASSGSILAHSAILVTLLTASHLRVESLTGPRSDVNLIVVPPVPPAPPLPPPPSGGAAAKARRPKEPPKQAPEIVQPEAPTHEAAEPEEGEGEPGLEGGMQGGVPDGVPGGAPGGIPGGVPGGIPGGTPGAGSVLEGLPGEDQPVQWTPDLSAPERTTFFKPQYPEVARKARAEGKVILEIVVGRTGDVEDVRVLRSNPLFDQAAAEAVKRWKYLPALQSGRPVRVYLTVVVEFQLK